MIGRVAQLIDTLSSGTGVRARLARGSFQSIAIGVVGSIISFVAQMALARTVGADDYGIYAIVVSWVNFTIIFATLGFDTGSLRFVSSFMALNDTDGARRYASYAYQVAIRGAVVLGLIAFTALQIMWRIKHQSWQGAGLALIALLPAYALLQLQGSMLQGSGSIIAAQAPLTIMRPLLFGLALGSVLILGHWRLSAGTALALNAIAALICAWYSHRVLRARLGNLAGHKAQPTEVLEWRKVNRTLLTMSALQLVASQQLGLMMVGILGAPRDAGIYSVANQLTLPLSLGVQAVVFVSVPNMGALFAQGRTRELQRVLRLSVAGGLLFLLPGLVFIAIGGRWVLSLYGAAFVKGYPILIALALMQAAALVGGVANALLVVAGRERAGATMVGITAMTNFALCLVLAGKYGMLGAAVAACITTLLRTVLFDRYVRSSMGFTLWPVHLGREPRMP